MAFRRRRPSGAYLIGMAKWRRYRRRTETEVVTNCWNPPGTNADWIGYRHADTAYGNIKYPYTASGTFVYAFELNKTTGEARLIFSDDDGVTPGYQEPNTTNIMIQATQFGNLELTWNETEEYYQDFNLELANALFEYHDTNPLAEVCFRAVAIPKLLIHYDFAEIVDEDKDLAEATTEWFYSVWNKVFGGRNG